MVNRLPYADFSPKHAWTMAVMTSLLMMDPHEVLALLDERREMRRALDRWADDGGPCA